MLREELLIPENTFIKDALKKLDKTAKKVLLIVDNEKRLLGTLTDGDIRRYILSGRSLENDIKEVFNKDPVFLREEEFSLATAKKIILEKKIELLPILDKKDKIVDFLSWNELFSEKKHPKKRKILNIPVIIMAGGKGTRLDPFTKILPKPLIPIGDKPIIEIIIEEFKMQGVNQFFVTLHHKSEMIEAYFNGIEKDYNIKFIKEKVALGTAGSLKLFESYSDDIFIVSNCDVLIRSGYEKFVNYHKENKALITILSPIKYFKIPYGVIKFKKGGKVEAIDEKPEYTFTVNSGVYIMNKESLRFIPKNSFYNMTDLIETLLNNNRKVMMYPVNEKDYIDIGQWEEYKKAIERLQFLI